MTKRKTTLKKEIERRVKSKSFDKWVKRVGVVTGTGLGATLGGSVGGFVGVGVGGALGFSLTTKALRDKKKRKK